MSVNSLPLGILLLPLICFGQAVSGDLQKPQLPCAHAAFPAYPETLNIAVVTFWDSSNWSRDWAPPDCTGWTSEGFSNLVSTTARFRAPPGQVSLLQRIGA